MASERTTALVLALVGIVGMGLMGALSLYLLRDRSRYRSAGMTG
jgi:hypothetical protein